MPGPRILLAAAVLLTACTPDDHAIREQSLPTSAVPPSAPTLTYSARVLPNADGTYGYEVSRGGKALIRQPNVPGQAGTRGFADSTRARQVALLVIGKLERGLMPPTVTPGELDSLGATD